MKDRRNTSRGHLHPLLVVALDALLLGCVLLVFAWFHHAGDAVYSHIYYAQLAQQTTPAPTTDPAATPTATPAPTQETTPAITTPPETTPEPTEPDNRTPWQIRFEEHFTDEVISTENAYSSPNVSVSIDTCVVDSERGQVVYYVVDIYVASLDCFKTYVAHNDLWHYSTEMAKLMDKASGAIVALSGDYYAIQDNSFTMRNGELYSKKNPTCDICVLYSDGTMKTYPYQGYTKDEVLANDPVQIWNFGPRLLDEHGQALTEFNISPILLGWHPRSALGYYEPGHYCFVTVDGRDNDHSAGMTMQMMANLFESLGCASAYNLDGGASSVLTFNDANYSRPVGERPLSDMIIVVEPAGEAEP